MGEWKAERSPLPYINEDDVDEAMGLRFVAMNMRHGTCAVGKLKVDDDEDIHEDLLLELE